MRYGSIRYVNNLPADWGLTSGQSARPTPTPDIEIVHGHPSELNRALAAGALDVSAVSAASLARGGALGDADVQVLPEATIASRGPVESVLLLSRVPFQDLQDRTILTTDESATGALLLRILLERDLGVDARYTTAPVDALGWLAAARPPRSGADTNRSPRAAGSGSTDAADAVMVIGDQALEVQTRLDAAEQEEGAPYVLDLGEAWRAYTGLPMVYALWTVRNDFADRAADDLDAFRHALDASVAWGETHRDQIVATAATRSGMAPARLRTYYQRLTYRLGHAERQGLRRFLEEAAALHQDAPDRVPHILEVRA